MDDEYITTQAAAAYLGVSDRTLRNYTKQKKIQHLKLSPRIIMYKTEWLDDFISRSTQLPEQKENEQ